MQTTVRDWPMGRWDRWGQFTFQTKCKLSPFSHSREHRIALAATTNPALDVGSRPHRGGRLTSRRTGGSLFLCLGSCRDPNAEPCLEQRLSVIMISIATRHWLMASRPEYHCRSRLVPERSHVIRVNEPPMNQRRGPCSGQDW
jgi:hypothetical protein